MPAVQDMLGPVLVEAGYKPNDLMPVAMQVAPFLSILASMSPCLPLSLSLRSLLSPNLSLSVRLSLSLFLSLFLSLLLSLLLSRSLCTPISLHTNTHTKTDRRARYVRQMRAIADQDAELAAFMSPLMSAMQVVCL